MRPCLCPFWIAIAALAILVVSHSTETKAQSFDGLSLNDRQENVLDGFTEPYRDISVGASDTSAVAEIRVDEGDVVRFGDIVARLDDAVAIAHVNVARQAAASTGESEASRLQMLTSVRKYESCLELHARNHATDQELWAMQSQKEEAVARNKAYEELATRRRLELVQAETQLQRMTIRSPIDGVIVERMKDIGEVVSPADAHILRIVQLDPLRISTTATIAQARTLKLGQKIPMTVDGKPSVSVVEFISPVADASSKTVIVCLRMANPDNLVPAGLSCKIPLEPAASESSPEPDRAVPRQTLKSFPFLNKSVR